MSEPIRPASAASDTSPRDTLSHMIRGYLISQAIFVALRLGIIDVLQGEPKSSDDLANLTQANPQALYRVLSVLAANGLRREMDQRRFVLTPLGALLQQGSSLRTTALMQAELYWPAYGELLYSVKTGKSAFEHAFGISVYDYLARNPEVDDAYTAT